MFMEAAMMCGRVSVRRVCLCLPLCALYLVSMAGLPVTAMSGDSSTDPTVDILDKSYNDPVELETNTLVTSETGEGLQGLVKNLQTQLRESYSNFAHTRSILNVIQEKQASQDRVIEILKDQLSTVQSQQKRNTNNINRLKKDIANSHWGIADLKLGQDQVRKDIRYLKRTQELTNSTIIEFEDFMAKSNTKDRDYRRSFGRVRLDISSLRNSLRRESKDIEELRNSYNEHMRIHNKPNATSGNSESNAIPVIVKQPTKVTHSQEGSGTLDSKSDAILSAIEERGNTLVHKLHDVLNHKEKISDFSNKFLNYDISISNLQNLFLNLTLRISELDRKFLTNQQNGQENDLGKLQRSLMNFTHQMLTMEQWRMSSISHTNISHQNLKELAEMRNLIHMQRHKLQKLELQLKSQKESNLQSFQYLKDRVSKINETSHQYSISHTKHSSKSYDDADKVRQKLHLFQDEITNMRLRISQAETKVANASLNSCKKGNKDMYQDAKFAVFQKDINVLEGKMITWERNTRHTDIELSRLYTVVDGASKTMDGITRELNRMVKLQPDIFDIKREINNMMQQLPKDCNEIYASNNHKNGLYVIRPQRMKHSVQAYCDMTSDNGGPFTYVQRRINGKVSFNKTWEQYKDGFGNPKSEFWIGNEALHKLTSQINYTLIIEMWDKENKYWVARYDTFKLSSESEGYRLTVGGYHGNATDAMHYSNNVAFSTADRDNDASSTHCARFYTAGWWYKYCHYCNLNGRFSVGIVWYNQQAHTWKQMKAASMKLKRRS